MIYFIGVIEMAEGGIIKSNTQGSVNEPFASGQKNADGDLVGKGGWPVELSNVVNSVDGTVFSGREDVTSEKVVEKALKL